MMTMRLATAIIGICLLGASAAGAAVYTGSLTSSDNGIIATPYWETVSLGWTVTELSDGSWRYNYDFMVSQDAEQPKFISHLLIEASLTFTETEDILFTNWVSDIPNADDVTVQQWTDQQGNPNIPGTLYGIKFNTVSPLPGSSTGTHWLVEFDSTRAPVWGDFYAKDGNVPGGSGTVITAWNAGFLLADPTCAPSNGSVDSKILRPDTVTYQTPPIPEAGSLGLALIGLAPIAIGRLRRR